jgi:hypothetical protein
VSNLAQLALDAFVSQAPVFGGAAEDVRSNLWHVSGSAYTSQGAPIILHRYEFPVQSEDGVRCDNRADIGQLLESDGLCEHSEPTALIFREPDLPRSDLFSKDMVFRFEILNTALLVFIKHTSENNALASENNALELPGSEFRCHGRFYKHSSREICKGFRITDLILGRIIHL